MAPSPKKIEELKNQQTTLRPTPSKKASNCFAIGVPSKPGLVLVSTDKLNQNGCTILSWEPQHTTMLISDAPEWYSYAGKILKANIIFTAVFAFALLIVLVVNRGRF